MSDTKLTIVEVPINELRASEYNPRKHSKEQVEQLKESINRFGMVDPVICNSTPERKNVIIGGHFRVEVAKEMGITNVPVVYIQISDLEKEKELNLRLNKNVGEFDLELLAEFDEAFLKDVGFDSEDLDNIFPTEENVEQFDLKKELEKVGIENITVQKGDIYELDGSRLMCGDSTIESDMDTLMKDVKADMCFTDPPYILNYLKGKTKQKDGVTTGFGAKKNRRYLETD
ncbi:MAG TPA: ParB N-terminal domain-containing protein [bacterium]|nr:ParB N-terminal domain-containing protein [bacterium]